MKKRIKYNFYIIKNILKKQNIVYLILSILAINLYCIMNTAKKYGFSYNLAFDLSNNYYLVLLISIILYFILQLINNLKNRVELITRFSNKESFLKFIFNNVVCLMSLIYIINLISLIVFRFFKHLFIINNEIFFIYNISTYLYIIWELIRNYIFIFFISYFITYVSFNYEKKSAVNFIIFLIYGFLLIPVANVDYVSFTSFLLFKNYGSLINEISYFIISYIAKYYFILFLSKIISIFNWNLFFKNVKLIIYKIINIIKKIYLPLLLYLVINIINILYLNSQDIELNDYDILCTANYASLSIISFATKCISVSCIIYILNKIIFLDLKKNACIIFTRISKKTWIIKKIISFIIIIIILRLPLYNYIVFSKIVIYDLIVYLILLLLTINYSLNESKTIFGCYILGILSIFIFDYFSILVYILIVLLVFSLIFPIFKK